MARKRKSGVGSIGTDTQLKRWREKVSREKKRINAHKAAKRKAAAIVRLKKQYSVLRKRK